jgi:putative serine protease PepD
MTLEELVPARPSSPPAPHPAARRPPGAVAAAFAALVLTAGGFLIGAGLSPRDEAADLTGATVAASAATTSAAAVAEGGSGSIDVVAVAESAAGSVVTVQASQTLRRFQTLTASGSGVVVDASGLIVTNAHVVDGAADVEVVTPDGATYEATVVGIDAVSDLAVISIDADGLVPIEIGTTDDLVVGQPVVAIGYPLALEGGPSVSTGIISALGRRISDADTSLTGVIQTDAAITEGSSGGALLDSAGRLIGITTAVGVSSVGVEGIGFAIPAETVARVLAELAA